MSSEGRDTNVAGQAGRMEAAGLLVLRLGLAWFLFVWAVNKILLPQQYQRIWSFAHGIEIGPAMPYVMGAAQIVICLAIASGFLRVVSYALGWAMHSVTTIVVSGALLHPFVIEDGFPINRNQSIVVAAWAGFAALWLLRRHDRWSLDARLARRRSSSAR